MVQTHLDEIISYKDKIIKEIGLSKEVVGLLLDNPNINMESDEAYSVFDNNLYNYNYIDETQTSARSLIMVDIEIPAILTGTIKDIYIYVQIAVPKETMVLDTSKFAGIKGNRKDNLLRQVDLILNNQSGFGIGKLFLQSVTVASCPSKYTSSLLTYSIPSFSRNRSVGNR